jgi:thymidylate kinase
VIVVVTGPIASGKTTLVKAIAEQLRGAGRVVATLDQDEIYELVEQRGVTAGTREAWARTHRLCVAFASALIADGVDAVVVETDAPQLFDGALHVTLSVPFEAALERAQRDPTRDLSRDQSFLRSHYDAYTAPADAGLTIDTGESGVDQAARDVLRLLGL